MISGTWIGLACVLALLMASIVLAVLNRREKDQSRFLSKLALVLFAAAFLGGVALTLTSGVSPREEHSPMTGGPMMGSEPSSGPMSGAAIGKIDEKEFQSLQEKVAKDLKDVKSRERLGHLYLQMQDFENVFKLAHEALQINPKSAESRVHMGMVFFAMQDTQQAMAQFDEALKIDPKNAEALRFKKMVSGAQK